MLPTINLPLPDITRLSTESSATAELSADSLQFSTSFAEQIVLPIDVVPLEDLPRAGQLLPQAGNVLPELPQEMVTAGQTDLTDQLNDLEGAESLDAGQVLLSGRSPALVDASGVAGAPVQVSPAVSMVLAENTTRTAAERGLRVGAITLTNTMSPEQAGHELNQASPVAPRSGQFVELSLQSALPTVDPATGRQALAIESSDLPIRAVSEFAAQFQGSADAAGTRQMAAQVASSTVQSADIAALHLQSTDRPAIAAATQTSVFTVDLPVKDAAWGDAINNQVLMMAGKKTQSAEIRLTPAELGPLRVQMSFDDGSAEITFSAQHAVTREALESALPRLRELFDDNGISLGNASVNEEGVEQSEHDSEATSADTHGAGEAVDPDAPGAVEATSGTRVTHDGLIDTFA